MIINFDKYYVFNIILQVVNNKIILYLAGNDPPFQ